MPLHAYDTIASARRVIQRDPIKFKGGMNHFAYCKNNPIRMIDPDGRNPLIVPVVVGGTIILSILHYIGANDIFINLEVGESAIMRTTLLDISGFALRITKVIDCDQTGTTFGTKVKPIVEIIPISDALPH